jgi:hypothetical protein
MQNLKQHRDSFVFKTGDSGPVVKFELYYDKGGANYFNGGNDARGIWASIRAVTLEKYDTHTIETFEIFGKGGRKLVKQLARKSDKELLAVAERLDAAVPGICSQFEQSEELGKQAMLDAIQSIQEER